MYLTAVLKNRTNNHDEHRLRHALARWHEYFDQSMAHAEGRQRELLRCLILWTPKVKAEVDFPEELGGNTTLVAASPTAKSRLVVDSNKLHKLVLEFVPRMPHLHSSCRMSMIVVVQVQLGSWLGIYADWCNDGKKSPKPGFPTVAPATPAKALQEWRESLAWSSAGENAPGWISLPDEKTWRARVTRAAKGTLLPLYFGAATSGADSQAHCGVLQRKDGRWFSLLTLLPAGDKLGEPVTRARNRLHRGAVRNPRGDSDFTPTLKSKASVMIPLELDRRTERLYLERGTLKSAHLVQNGGAFYLHVASDVAQADPGENSGAVLAIQRGITTLVSAVVLDGIGNVLARRSFSDKGLAELITQIGANRAKKQAKGKLTTGDRRASRITEAHLHILAHDIVDLAREYSVKEISVLADPFARKPQRFLAYKHWSELFEILARCCKLAGAATPLERKLYASPRTCTHCGAAPGKEMVFPAGTCVCGEEQPSDHISHLLGLDTLRFRGRAKSLPRLGAWIASRSKAVG